MVTSEDQQPKDLVELSWGVESQAADIVKSIILLSEKEVNPDVMFISLKKRDGSSNIS